MWVEKERDYGASFSFTYRGLECLTGGIIPFSYLWMSLVLDWDCDSSYLSGVVEHMFSLQVLKDISNYSAKTC